MKIIRKKDLESPSEFKEKFRTYINELTEEILDRYNIKFSFEELGDLLLSACRANDFDIVSQKGNVLILEESRVEDWIDQKLIPNTIVVQLDDEDVLRLMVFCFEITYSMFSGESRATITQKGFRERKRTFEATLVDQFVGKLGEIFVKKFLENNFNVKIELDWEISTEIERYRNDIMNAKKNVSIKSSSNLAGIWAEADKGYDYGIMVKCSVPLHPILQFFIETCGFMTLLEFIEQKIKNDKLFRDYIERIKRRIKINDECEIKTKLKGFICGYFKTSNYKPVKVGIKLPYLGEVKEERYLVPINELKWEKKDWIDFLKDIEIL